LMATKKEKFTTHMSTITTSQWRVIDTKSHRNGWGIQLNSGQRCHNLANAFTSSKIYP